MSDFLIIALGIGKCTLIFFVWLAAAYVIGSIAGRIFRDGYD